MDSLHLAGGHQLGQGGLDRRDGDRIFRLPVTSDPQNAAQGFGGERRVVGFGLEDFQDLGGQGRHLIPLIETPGAVAGHPTDRT